MSAACSRFKSDGMTADGRDGDRRPPPLSPPSNIPSCPRPLVAQRPSRRVYWHVLPVPDCRCSTVHMLVADPEGAMPPNSWADLDGCIGADWSRLQERRPTRGGSSNCADNCVNRRSSIRASRPDHPKYLAWRTDRPCVKIETDRDRDLFQRSDRDRSTLEKVRS